jgi:antitoxin VapB
MRKAKLFKNGQSQAVRLPKEFRFEGNEVYVKRVKNGVLLMPVQHTWDALIKSLDTFPADFMNDRAQPPMQQEREELL